jgi:aminoglycoside phosphotransferase (APT) family kinase protein
MTAPEAPPAELADDPAALRRVLVEAGLAAPDESPRAVPLTGGVSSAILRVDVRGGCYAVKQALPKLRVAKDWRVPVERVFAEIDWLRAAAAVVPGHVPAVLWQDAGTKSFVMPFLGDDHRNWKSELLAGRVDAAVAASLGTVLGRVHAAHAGRDDVARRFAHDAQFHALRLEPYLAETARAHPALAPRLRALIDRTATTRLTLVHGDVSPKNVLVGPHRAPGPVLLDAECAWYGDPAFDAAFLLNHLLLKAVHRPQDAAVLGAAFDAFAAAYRAPVAWEPWPALEARIASLLPGLALARVDGKSPVEYLDGPGRERVRARAMALVAEPPATLAALQRGWNTA